MLIRWPCFSTPQPRTQEEVCGCAIWGFGYSPWRFGANWRAFGVDQGRSGATKRSVTRSGGFWGTGRWYS